MSCPSCDFRSAVSCNGGKNGGFCCSAGALNGEGAVLRVANVTISDARVWCLGNPACGGFTSNMGKPAKHAPTQACDTTSADVHQVYFKGSLSGTNGDPLWRMWQKPNYTSPSYRCESGKCVTCPASSPVCDRVTFDDPSCFDLC